MSSLVTALSGTPGVNTVTNVKSQPIQDQVNSSLSDLSALQAQGKTSISKFISDYMGNDAAAKAETANEVGSVNRYYNGDVEKALAGIRAQRQASVLNAAKLAQEQALAGQKGTMLTGQGGPSSYENQEGLKNFTNISTAAALDNADQTSKDYATVLAGQQANLGRSNQLLDSQASRALVPYQAQSQVLANGLGMLGSLQGINNNNNFYGLKQDRNQAADIVGSIFNNGANGAGSYMATTGGGMLSGLGGLFGGGAGGGAASSGSEMAQMAAANGAGAAGAGMSL